jgi:two-component system cell cycle sensor histidine kinase/response regulator CckA
MDDSKKTENQLTQGLTELRKSGSELTSMASELDSKIAFGDLFNLEEIQRIQDEFAAATGVASIITDPAGTPLTAPSNFTYLCNDIIRKTKQGCSNCFKSDAAIGRYHPEGPIVQPCLSGGLWDAGASITVGGYHIANWLIGQVRNETQSEESMRSYAREIGADEELFMKAFDAVPAMSYDRFEQIARVLFTLANQLSTTAYQNVQQARYINERKKAEDEIRKSKHQYDNLVSQITIGTYILHSTPAETFVLDYASPRMAEMLKLSVESLLSDARIVFQAIHPDDRDSFLKLNLDGIQQRRPFDWEGRVLIEGTVKWLHIMSLPEPMENGDVLWYGIVDDITGRKRAEEALRIAEKTFRDLLETIQLVAILLDREGNITFCNDYLLHLTGWEKEEVLGRNWFDLFISSDDREKLNAMFSSALGGEEYFLHHENIIVTHEGKERLISWNNTVLHDLEGKISGTASIGIDITEQKDLEAQLRQSQKMEAVGQLAGGIAHDFNNILSAIVGYAYLVQTRMGSDDPSRDDVDQILDSANRAAEVTNSLLAFSKKQNLNPKPVLINDVVKRSEKLLSRVIGEDIIISTSFSGNEMECMADSAQIEQVLMNLATNARDAMPHGGNLALSTECVEIDESFIRDHGFGRLGMFALISVSDTGVGMCKETAAKIFEPFFTTKETGKGTGLGLAMVYGIIKQHDGYIDVHSEPGIGTTFNIYLPAAESKKEVTVTTIESPPLSGTETLLVVEDNEKLRKLSEIILKQHGYEVILAQDGQEGLAKFIENKDRIRLVLLDMIMPKKSGKYVYDEIKRVKPDMKVIFVSGYTADRIDKESLVGENVDFLFKPVLPKDLLRKVREMLEK